MLELIFQQCSKEAEIASTLYKWLLQWMAYPLQNPGAKMGSAVVMHGPQGTGKSLIFTTLAEIYGYGRRRRNYAIVIDGQATTTTHVGGSGFFTVSLSNPAVGDALMIDGAGLPVEKPTIAEDVVNHSKRPVWTLRAAHPKI